MKLREISLALLFFLATTFWLYSEVLWNGKLLVTTGLIQSDLLNQNFPFRWHYYQELKAGRIGLWTNLIGNGLPVLATGQTGGLYPVNFLLFRFLPFLVAWNTSLFFHLVWAALGVYLYCRTLKLSKTAGIIAGLSFAFSGFATIHLMHVAMIQVISWLPFSLIIFEKMLRRANLTGLVIIQALIWTLQALAGHHEILFFIVLIEFIYLSLRTFQLTQRHFWLNQVKVWAVFGLAGISALLLAAPQILPTWELTRLSPRAQGVSFAEATGYMFPLQHLLTLVNPRSFKFSETVRYSSLTPDAINLWETYLYLGIISLVLAVFGLLTMTKRLGHLKKAWLILIAVSFILALGRATPLFGWLWQLLPPLRLFKSPTRFLVFLEMGLAFGAGLGWDNLASRKIPSRIRFLLAGTVICLIIADLKINNVGIHLTDNPKIWLSPPPTARLLAFALGSRYHSLGTNLFDYRLIDDLKTQRELRNLLPSDYGMLWQLPAASFQAGLFTSTQLLLLRGFPEDRLGWDEPTQTFIVPESWLRRISIQSVEFIFSPLPLSHPELVPLGSFAFSRPLPGQFLFPEENGYHPVQILGTHVYRNLRVWPRAFLVDHENLAQLLTAGIPQLDLPPKTSAKLGDVSILSSDNSSLFLEVKTRKPATLVLLDLDYPGWKAFVDGHLQKSHRVAYAFRALNLSAGTHQITWAYQPDSFRTGIILSLGGIALLLGLYRLKVKIPLLPPMTNSGHHHQEDQDAK